MTNKIATIRMSSGGKVLLMFMLVLPGLKVEETAGHTGLEPVISALAWEEFSTLRTCLITSPVGSASISVMKARSRVVREFIYLAVLLDAFSRRCIGWAISRHIDTQLTLSALQMALNMRTIHSGLIHHSDRGVQYAATDYVAGLHEHKIEISMSRTGNL